jgi:hypothetical protein
MRRATAFVALLLGLGALGCLAVAALAPGGSSAAPMAAGSLTCSVKDTDCNTGAGEVEVFRMSFDGNAHAGTPGGSTYGYKVCCGGVTGLGTSCSGTYDTVLTLSATDNAAVASDASYATQVCLSVGAEEAMNCTYGTSCGGSACLATISGTTNAHVADCDGTGDYATRVCCTATTGGGPVGGIAELPEVSADSSGPNYVALAGIAAVALVAFAAGARYARRRWGR